MREFFDVMYRDYCEGLKELTALRNNNIERLRRARLESDHELADELAETLVIQNEEIAEMREAVRQIETAAD